VIAVSISENRLLIPVFVTPRGGKNCLLSFEADDDAVKIKVSAPPEDGKANAAVLKLLADVLKLPKSRLSVVAGEKSRHKRIAAMLQTSEEAALLLNRLADALKTSVESFQHAGGG
jgi:uncharacterized protein (TIGR00251 family)